MAPKGFRNPRVAKLCRLCLAHVLTYTDIVQNERISQKLVTLTSIQVAPNDEISTVMCLKCQLNLNLAYMIQQNMLRAERRFRQQLEAKTAPAVDLETHDDTTAEESDTEHPVAVPRKTIWEDDHHLDENICATCCKEFPTKSLLAKHEYFHKKSKCPICSKEVTSINLRSHMEIHDNNPHVCDICGVTLKTKSNLRQHKYYTHNAARHKCEYCDRMFVKKTTRDSHQRKEHLGKADFVCDTCGKKFYSWRTLTTHVKMTHLKLRPFVCEFCNCGFSSSFAMKTHRRQHTNETPYRCEICGEGFRQKVSLKAHRKSKHNIVEAETCRCPVCDKGFASKTALNAHRRVHM